MNDRRAMGGGAAGDGRRARARLSTCLFSCLSISARRAILRHPTHSRLDGVRSRPRGGAPSLSLALARARAQVIMAGRALKVHCESEGEREAWMRELRQVCSSSLSL